MKHCASTCATTFTGPPSGRCANCCPNPTTASPWPTKPTATACPSRTSPTRQCDNDKHLIAAAADVMADLLRAAGAHEVITIKRYAHLVGGARMASSAQDGVIDAEHRVFGVDRLYVVDGSVMPTQGAANPALTIMALAARAADLMTRHAARS